MPETTTVLAERICVYVILRYTPNLVRDEWVNIGVLLFDPASGERRLRLIEDQEEFARVRRLHPAADEGLLRGLRDDLEDRLRDARHAAEGGDWQKLLAKWDDTLSNALQLPPPKRVHAEDPHPALQRLYPHHLP